MSFGRFQASDKPVARDERSTNGDGKAGPSEVASTSKPKDPQSDDNLSLTESQMNRVGYQLLGLKRIKDALEVFKQNTLDFPNEFNTWDSLAEGYIVSGDKPSAIKYYKKSLELNPDNTSAVQKLKELGG